VGLKSCRRSGANGSGGEEEMGGQEEVARGFLSFFLLFHSFFGGQYPLNPLAPIFLSWTGASLPMMADPPWIETV